MQPYHGRTVAMAFDPKSLTLAILGEGAAGKPMPGRSLSLWSTQGAQIKLRASVGQPVVGQAESLLPDFKHGEGAEGERG
jgi:hypothetical protein